MKQLIKGIAIGIGCVLLIASIGAVAFELRRLDLNQQASAKTTAESIGTLQLAVNALPDDITKRIKRPCPCDHGQGAPLGEPEPTLAK